MSETITLLIVDDHAVVRRGIRAFLASEENFEVVGDVSSGAEAILLASDRAPDVILMDLIMPDMGGVETTRRIKQIRRLYLPGVKVSCNPLTIRRRIIPRDKDDRRRTAGLSLCIPSLSGSEICLTYRKQVSIC
ncbi:MAG: response regulator transcription factor [Chloroflexota bacterium]|nr:response regulator transcription factor [Chloroflexota bacterium]